MTEINIDIDIDIECSECHNELDVSQDNYGTIKVEPCETCLEQKFNEGKEQDDD